MTSMTGYACCEKSGEIITIIVEIKGYNNRYLDVSVNLPPWLFSLETKIRQYVASKCGRGKIDVYVRIREYNVPVNINVNINAAKSFYNAIDELAMELKILEKPTLSQLVQMDNMVSGSIFEIEKMRDPKLYWSDIEPIFYEAVKIFCKDRAREGKNTKTDIIANLEKIENSLKIVISFAAEIEDTIKENIRRRFEELLGNKIDENRVLSETALLLMKYTISEEISRLSSHLGEFRDETQKKVCSGKKLDFLCQEINREVNTIGSKSAIIKVTNEVIIMKESLENIREQLRNIE